MDSLYGEFKKEQIVQVKKSLRGNIFFLLLCADPSTSEQYKEVDVNKSYEKMKRLGEYNNNLLVFINDLPDISLKDNYDKYIISGNKDKTSILEFLIKK